jgi:hypothetical protein
VDNVKMDLRGTGWDGMDWIDLDQDRDQWRALVNPKGFHKTLWSSWVAAQMAASQEGLSSMKLFSYCSPIYFYVFQITSFLEVSRKENYTFYFTFMHATCSAHISLLILIILIIICEDYEI